MDIKYDDLEINPLYEEIPVNIKEDNINAKKIAFYEYIKDNNIEEAEDLLIEILNDIEE